VRGLLGASGSLFSFGRWGRAVRAGCRRSAAPRGRARRSAGTGRGASLRMSLQARHVHHSDQHHELRNGGVGQLLKRGHRALALLDRRRNLFVRSPSLPARIRQVGRFEHRAAWPVTAAELAVTLRTILLPGYDRNVLEPGCSRSGCLGIDLYLVVSRVLRMVVIRRTPFSKVGGSLIASDSDQ